MIVRRFRRDGKLRLLFYVLFGVFGVVVLYNVVVLVNTRSAGITTVASFPRDDRISGYVVPNIIHYIWFANDHRRSLLFLHYISIVSAYLTQSPDAIFFHCNHLPSGMWWDRVWREIPTLRVVYREPPATIYGQPLAHVYHKGDVAKMDILLEHGGIYLDYDVIVVNRLDPLRRFDATIGEEKAARLNFGVVIARPNSKFLRLLRESYRNNYRGTEWDYNCAIVAYGIYKNHTHTVHVEPRRLTTPDWLDRRLLWDEVIDWHDLYVVHVLGQVKTKFSPENIRLLNSTFGQLMRNVYYGSPDIVVGKSAKKRNGT